MVAPFDLTRVPSAAHGPNERRKDRELGADEPPLDGRDDQVEHRLAALTVEPEDEGENDEDEGELDCSRRDATLDSDEREDDDRKRDGDERRPAANASDTRVEEEREDGVGQPGKRTIGARLFPTRVRCYASA